MDLSQSKHVLVFRPYLSWVYLGQIQTSTWLLFVLFDVQTNVIADLSYICLVDKCGQIHHFTQCYMKQNVHHHEKTTWYEIFVYLGLFISKSTACQLQLNV